MATSPITGERAFHSRMTAMSRKLSDARTVFKRIAQVYERDIKRNMTSGKDPDGRPLAPVTPWTRTLRAGLGNGSSNMTPLIATGQLRNSVGATQIGTDSLRFGFHGRQSLKAESMVYGIPGYMRVKASRIRTSKKGGKYVRHQIGGSWTTASEGRGRFDGSSIRVTPRRRDFFYMSQDGQETAEKIMHEYVEAM